MKTYYLRPVPGGDDGGYGVVWRASGPQRVWVPLWRARGVRVRDVFFGSARIASLGRARAVLVQGLEVRVSYSRWWFFLWLYRWLRALRR